ncbi:MAG: MarP family serine protease [Mycetocola reblochoni]|uniref:Periplasmic serine proteinase n=1 Tax=Mycetocola reblochoni REB411 TaxID=1255698 RepID=A0A1R4KCF7_9MICO|nr:MarP family serine protease [Mycetocola reblochoni]SJN42000.1 periplasmic serine proteinase [Mycetocola reblochoni REB411]
MTAALVIDILLALALLGTVLRGWSSGFFRVLGSLAGLGLGAVATYLTLPALMSWVPDPSWRVPAAIAATVVLVAGGAVIGSIIGTLFRTGARKIKLGLIDRLAGAAASLAVGALTILLISSGITALGTPWLTPAVAGSRIVQTIQGLTPAPLATALSEARDAFIAEAPAWVVDTVDAPALDGVAAPAVDVSTEGVETALDSVALISGTAAECGVNMTGSGFVVAPGRIVTNAHVVAGVDRPVVDLPNELPSAGRVVYWDAEADLAVIAVESTETSALPLSATLGVGSEAVVAGHPLGGPLAVGGASVLAAGPLTLSTTGADTVTRDAYTLAASVKKGNSGGPVLTTDGAVAGVVFGTSRTEGDIAYAVTMAELTPVVAEAPSLVKTVPSGSCETAG